MWLASFVLWLMELSRPLEVDGPPLVDCRAVQLLFEAAEVLMENRLARSWIRGLSRFLARSHLEHRYHTGAIEVNSHPAQLWRIQYLSNLCHVFRFIMQFLDDSIKSRSDLPKIVNRTSPIEIRNPYLHRPLLCLIALRKACRIARHELRALRTIV